METESHTTPVQTAYLQAHRTAPKQFFSLLAVRWLVFVFGLMIMSYGIVAVVKANLGASPWDVLHLGISWNTGLSFGRVQQLVGVAILASAGLLLKKWPSLGAVANMLLVGEFCDLILRFHLVPEYESVYARIGLFTAGILIWGFGTGVYIQSNLGAGPRDWLMLALHQKTGWAIRWVRTFLEVSAVGLGIWLGGPFAWGTVAFSLTIGHATEYGLRLAKKWLGRYTERGDVA
ncbi:YczE/YyaS/YitT family protein [Effusibacillus pohliae]|uniref:YczE/YyaS/YitT family protein n=1 Tax=Effusibacillus pohliae TaxID=232270 RepID=UPI00037D8651|nr:membrane protein [Effusibacillus pohliae]